MVKSSLNFYDSDHRVLVLEKSCLVDGGPKPFMFQPHWFEEKKLISLLQGWWEESNATGNIGFVFHSKLKLLKGKIKHWVKENISKVEEKISLLEGLLLSFDFEEEDM